jgi:hypothetical protein
MGAYIDKKVDNFNRTESESYLQSIIVVCYFHVADDHQLHGNGRA